MKVIDQINKKFGDNSIFLLGQDQSDILPVIPTGSLKLDVALGVGGIPRGRIIEIFGPESSGKTTLCQHIIAQAQQMGDQVAFVDVEHSLDPYWLDICKVDIDNLLVSQPDTGEQALDIVEQLVRSKEVGIIIVDSVAALAPKAEIEGEMGDAHMALVARLMSQAMRKLTHVVKESQCSVIFTNQLRDKVGVSWGNPEDTTGGKALRYYAAIRIDLRKGEPIKDKDEVIGNSVKATVRKNKVGAPYKIANFSIYYDTGISYISDLIDYAIEGEIIIKGGAGWYTFKDQKVQGMPSLRQSLKEDTEFLQGVEDQVRTQLGLPIRR